MLEPRRLLTFREVARRASFSRAAEALSLTQPAVSQQVAALEREIGLALIDRRPGRREAKLAVGAFASAMATVVPDAVARWRESAPGVAVEALELSSADAAAG